MLEIEEIKYLVSFGEEGTLSKVAQEYHISQPTITRAMKNLEDTFGVPLFDRTKNHISLNENGRLAVQELSILLKQMEDTLNKVRNLDRTNRTISIGSAAAIALPNLTEQFAIAFPNKTIATEYGLPKDLEVAFKNKIYQFIILPYLLKEKDVSYQVVGEEHLMFCLPKKHRYAKRKSISLEELNGENMLMLSNVGFWEELVRKKMPNSKFLIQSERYTLDELIQNSNLACFTTNYTMSNETIRKTRVFIPITNPEVNVTYYLFYRKDCPYHFTVNHVM